MAYRWTEDDLQLIQSRLPVTAPASEVNARLKRSMRSKSAKNPNKYGNAKVRDAEGNVHDSTKEFRRWQELQLRERAGEITGLRRQVPFALVVNDVLVCSYEADAVYHEGAALVVEDTKSEITRKKRDYRIKLKLMQAIHGIQIREV
jgi:hypothetical protein